MIKKVITKLLCTVMIIFRMKLYGWYEKWFVGLNAMDGMKQESYGWHETSYAGQNVMGDMKHHLLDQTLWML